VACNSDRTLRDLACDPDIPNYIYFFGMQFGRTICNLVFSTLLLLFLPEPVLVTFTCCFRYRSAAPSDNSDGPRRMATEKKKTVFRFHTPAGATCETAFDPGGPHVASLRSVRVPTITLVGKRVNICTRRADARIKTVCDLWITPYTFVMLNAVCLDGRCRRGPPIKPSDTSSARYYYADSEIIIIFHSSAAAAAAPLARSPNHRRRGKLSPCFILFYYISVQPCGTVTTVCVFV
jgi:hypothetical protein